MTKRCYYEFLEVERTANDGQLKAAFRKLAMKYHPDRNPGDNNCEHRFKEINEAYDVLKDGDKRAAYDRFGHAAFEQGGMARHTASARISLRLSPIFSTISSAWAAARPQRRRPRARRRPALQHGDHARGRLSRQDRPGAHPDIGYLRGLLGLGRQGRHQAEGLHDLRRRRPRPPHARLLHPRAHLPVCQGRGQVIDKPCQSCVGAGRVTRERTLSVNIPAGVEDGTRIRLAGEGEAGVRGGPAGDLYIFLSLKRTPFSSATAPTCIAECRCRW